MQIQSESVSKFVALGGTFQTHQDEKDRKYRWPDLWIVPDDGIVSEDVPIQIPARTEKIKPGVELTAIIGDEIHQANEQEAWEAIKGFSISNDVTASGDWPGWSDPDHGMITGVGYKSFPTFSPLLTDAVEKDNEAAYDDLDVSVYVDDEIAVSGSTAQLAFSIPELVSFASQITRLHENDVVALGDPGDPSLYLDDADSVTCEIEGIGSLSNPIKRM